MPAKPDDVYGTYGSVPTTESQGGGGRDLDTRATSQDFGGQVGGALEQLGQTSEKVGGQTVDLATQYAKMATESKADDDYANKYAPAAAELRSQFDQLRGQDKVNGYDGYIKGLQGLNQQFVSNAQSPYEQKLIGGLITRHVAGEVDGAKRELVSALNEHSDQSLHDMINANSNWASSNYNNPQLVGSIIEQNNAHITKNYIDAGHDPLSTDGQATIEQAQRTATGNTAVGMINSALSRGDAQAANSLRSDYGIFIPGYQQQTLDQTLHVENMRQTGTQTIGAIKNGNPMPNAVGAPPYQVQANVANAAGTIGVDPNAALTVLRIESGNGQNLGTRGTIGQDKESTGQPLDIQAQTLCNNLKKAGATNQSVLGRPSEPWENYITYQQGAGGGPALLQAASTNPTNRAVDVLAPLYPNRQQALKAVMDNGGNASMTAEDFVDFLHNKYDQNAKIAACDTPQSGGNTALTNNSLADQIRSSHETTVPAVQPGATPVAELENFNKRYPQIIQQIQNIPNMEVRNSVYSMFERDHKMYSDAATSYKQNLVQDSAKVATQPDFTSMDQLPAETRAALMSDSPQTLSYMEKQAEYNSKHTQNIVSRDNTELGTGFYNLLDKVYAPSGNQRAITDISQLHGHVGQDLTIPGYQMLSKELALKNTPEGQAEMQGKQQLLAYGKSQISGSNAGLFIHDPRGEEKFTQWMALTLSSYDKGIGSGKTAGQLLSPSSPDYIGKTADAFKRSPGQMTRDMVYGADTKIPSQYVGNQARTIMDVARDLDAGKINRAEAEKQASLLGKMATMVPAPKPELTNKPPEVPDAM